MDDSIYYGFHEVLTRNALWNFIVGGRGIGKSYGAKKLVIKRGIRKGRQFVYVRRYKDELRLAANTFFSDVAKEFPGARFRRHEGWLAQYTYDPEGKDAKWHTIGYFVALSQMQNTKSVQFPDVDYVIYDEFIAEKGRHPLTDEVEVFKTFYETVDRREDRVKVLFIANSVSLDNPYFVEYDIQPIQGVEFIRRDYGFILVHFPESAAYKDAKAGSRWTKFNEGTAYGDYSTHNQFNDGHDALIVGKSSKARPMYALDTGRGVYSVWFDTATGLFYVQRKTPPDLPVYTLMLQLVDEDTTLLLKSDARVKWLKKAYSQGVMFFDRPQTRNTFIKVFK